MKNKKMLDNPIGYVYEHSKYNSRTGEYKTYQRSRYAFDKQTIKEALRNENSYDDGYDDTYTTLTEQLKLLEMDIDSDLERNKIMRYQSMYKDSTLQAIYNDYIKAYNLISSSKKWNFSRSKIVKQKLDRLKKEWGLKDSNPINDATYEDQNKLWVFKGVKYIDIYDPEDYYICDEEFRVIAKSEGQAISKLINKFGRSEKRELIIDSTEVYNSSETYKKYNLVL